MDRVIGFYTAFIMDGTMVYSMAFNTNGSMACIANIIAYRLLVVLMFVSMATFIPLYSACILTGIVTQPGSMTRVTITRKMVRHIIYFLLRSCSW